MQIKTFYCLPSFPEVPMSFFCKSNTFMDQKGSPFEGQIHRERKEWLQGFHLALLSQTHSLEIGKLQSEPLTQMDLLCVLCYLVGILHGRIPLIDSTIVIRNCSYFLDLLCLPWYYWASFSSSSSFQVISPVALYMLTARWPRTVSNFPSP